MQSLGRFQIIEEIGRGGCGVVYKALDPKIGRHVAIKTILPGDLQPLRLSTPRPSTPNDATNTIGTPQSSLYQRLQLEAQSAGRLSHPNIVVIHELDEQAGTTFVVMEYVAGRTLAALMREQPAVDLALHILAQTADALDHAHEHGVVHRDIKPANILLTPQSMVKITDFGIAKVLQSEVQLTRTGAAMGTAYYMAPEQIAGKTVSPQTDQFALGVIAFELFTGTKPFNGDSYASVLHQILSVDPAPVSDYRADLGEGVNGVLRKALAKNAANRYATCAEFAGDLAAAAGVAHTGAVPHFFPTGSHAGPHVGTRTGPPTEARTGGHTGAHTRAQPGAPTQSYVGAPTSSVSGSVDGNQEGTNQAGIQSATAKVSRTQRPWLRPVLGGGALAVVAGALGLYALLPRKTEPLPSAPAVAQVEAPQAAAAPIQTNAAAPEKSGEKSAATPAQPPTQPPTQPPVQPRTQPLTQPLTQPRVQGGVAPAPAPAPVVDLGGTPVPPPVVEAPKVAERPKAAEPPPVKQAPAPVAPPAPAPAAPPAPAPIPADERAWAELAGNRTVAALEQFRREHPNSTHAREAQELIEQMDWERIRASTDARVLNDYLTRFPSSRFAENAREQLRRLDLAAGVRQTRQLVEAALQQYRDAFSHRSMDELRHVWPGLTRQEQAQFQDFFRNARAVNMTLRPQGEPEISGDTATVRAVRSIQMTSERGKVPAQENTVLIHLRRAGQEMVIDSIGLQR